MESRQKSVAELEEELKQAKMRESRDTSAELVKLCEEKLLKRCFAVKESHEPNGGGSCQWLYVSRVGALPNGVSLATTVLNSTHVSNPRDTRRPFGLRCLNGFETFSSRAALDEFIGGLTREVSRKEFLAAQRDINQIGMIGAGRLGRKPTKQPAVQNEADPPEGIDLPLLLLTPAESRFVSGWYSLNNGTCMILTPASRKAVLAELDRDDESFERVRHLLQACDMPYTTSNAEAKSSLRRKLANAPFES